MQQFLWFALPGGLMIAAWLVLSPSSFERLTDAQAVILLALAPAAGFVFHQTYRLWFELTGAFHRRGRKSIDRIIALAKSRQGLNLDRRTAFLVWELVFYGTDFPSAFRDHNRGSWHYIFSFWSTSLAAAVGLIWLLASFLTEWQSASDYRIPALVILLLVAVVFWLKGRTTFRSLNDQETATVDNQAELFLTCALAISAKSQAASTSNLGLPAVEPSLPHTSPPSAPTPD